MIGWLALCRPHLHVAFRLCDVTHEATRSLLQLALAAQVWAGTAPTNMLVSYLACFHLLCVVLLCPMPAISEQ